MNNGAHEMRMDQVHQRADDVGFQLSGTWRGIQENLTTLMVQQEGTGERIRIPKSCIHESSQVQDEGNYGSLVVMYHWALVHRYVPKLITVTPTVQWSIRK